MVNVPKGWCNRKEARDEESSNGSRSTETGTDMTRKAAEETQAGTATHLEQSGSGDSWTKVDGGPPWKA